MLRWLGRLLLVGLILGGIAFAVSRFLGQDEDFDDFDDIEEGFEYTETPVEIDVPADTAPSNATQALGSDTTQALGLNDTGTGTGTGTGTSTGGSNAEEAATSDMDGSAMENTTSGADGSSDGGSSDGAQDGSEEALAEMGLQEIKGIGPAYEQSLIAIGINNPGDLLSADPSALSEQLSVIGGQETVEGWISQARDLASQAGSGSDGDNATGSNS